MIYEFALFVKGGFFVRFGLVRSNTDCQMGSKHDILSMNKQNTLDSNFDLVYPFWV
jgi:hypothetical protein